MKKLKQNFTLKKFSSVVFFLLISFFTLSAQTYKINGSVIDENGQTLIGVSILVKGTSKGAVTNLDGEFSLDINSGDILVFSLVGYKNQEVTMDGSTKINVTLLPGINLEELVVVGSRNPNRSATDSPVPIDVLNIEDVTLIAPQDNLNLILNYAAPSFTSTTQTVSDGTDHIDPASLRGLGPDQVLVLINGKRRHTTSLVNVNSTVGRGSVGTDLNAIPASAIKRIEVLRDGASAQYGSDAIAGVINIVLKNQTEGLEVSINSGAHFTEEANNQTGGVDGEKYQIDVNYGMPLGEKGGYVNFTGSMSNRERTFRAGKDGFSGSIYHAYNAIEYVAQNSGADIANLSITDIKNYAQNVSHFSNQFKADINNATDLAALRTLLNMDVTDSELTARGLRRQDFSMRVGQSEIREGKFFANLLIPISENMEFYSFGGLSYRKGQAAGFYRRPDQSRANTTVYLDGFLPEIASDILDGSVAFGIRGKRGEWDIDFSNTYGKNSFDFNILNTSNATMGRSTPKEFYAGGFSFSQNTTNLDIRRFYDNIFQGFNVAFGAEFRLENYMQLAGQEESYSSYDTNGNVYDATNTNSVAVTDFFGRARPGGAQVFPGYRPENARDKYRNSFAAYVDFEADFTQNFLLSTAIRYENYEDFGNTLNIKLATRLKASKNINLRAAFSTGFRAPSLHQLHFNATSTNFINGIPFEIGTFSNDSRIAELLGIPELKEEESLSASLGFTAKIPSANLTITIDAFYTEIDDRVILTDNFSRPNSPGTDNAQLELQRLFDRANATRARFFANAIDTETKGVDVVLDHIANIWGGKLKSDLALSYAKTTQEGDIHASEPLAAAGLTDVYFSERSRYFLEFAQPKLKANLSNSFSKGKWKLFLRNAFFGSVENPDLTDTNGDGTRDTNPTYGSKIVTDLSLSYEFFKDVRLTIGANNIFDVYPDLAPADLTSGNNFIFPRATSQFAFNGRYLFGRLSFKLR